MRHVLTLGLLTAALLTLQGCGSSRGGVRVEAPDEATLAACETPQTYLGVDDWEIMTGRIGDALILCRKKHAALADYARAVSKAVHWPE